jgi:hypothetical protein
VGRQAWVPWCGATGAAILVAVIGYPDWLAAVASVLVFVFADERRYRGALPSAPLIQNRREAWLFVVSECLLVALGIGSIVSLVSGKWFGASWTWLLIWGGGLFAVQFLNVVRNREHGDSVDERSLRGARHEGWALIRCATGAR